MRVRWLRTDLHNLDEDAGFIAEDDPEAARLVVERILAAVAMLTAHPELGPPRAGTTHARTGDPEDAQHRALPRAR
jgi:plasmid stabilization system protein ParE